MVVEEIVEIPSSVQVFREAVGQDLAIFIESCSVPSVFECYEGHGAYSLAWPSPTVKLVDQGAANCVFKNVLKIELKALTVKLNNLQDSFFFNFAVGISISSLLFLRIILIIRSNFQQLITTFQKVVKFLRPMRDCIHFSVLVQ